MSEIDHFQLGNILVHTELDEETEQYQATFTVPLAGTDWNEASQRQQEFTAAMRVFADFFDKTAEELEDEDEDAPVAGERPSVDEQQTILSNALGSFRKMWLEIFPNVPLALTGNTDECGVTFTSWDGEHEESIDPQVLRMAGQALQELADNIDTSDHPENHE